MSNPLLYIRGEKEPIALDYDDAKAIEQVYLDDSKDHRSKIVIEDVWTGTKGDIKYIKWPKPEFEARKRLKVEAMSSKDVAEFEEKIRVSKIEAESSPFGTHSWPLFYLQWAGAVQLEVALDAKGREQLYEVVTDPFLYPVLQDELESYHLYLDRKNYAERMQEQEYEEMSEQLNEALTT